jgi:hypothetical protein
MQSIRDSAQWTGNAKGCVEAGKEMQASALLLSNSAISCSGPVAAIDLVLLKVYRKSENLLQHK